MAETFPVLYEFTRNKDEAQLTAGTALLRVLDCSPGLRQAVEKEAAFWQAVERVNYHEVLYWHDDDERDSSYPVIHECGRYLVENGTFAGMVVTVSGEGKEREFLLLCTDGRIFGQARRPFYRSSEEVDREGERVFTLEWKRK